MSSTAAAFEPVLRLNTGDRVLQLIQDTDFAAGFRAYQSCTQFEGSTASAHIPALPLGDCGRYEESKNDFTVRSFPGEGAPIDAGKFWNFNEGVHEGYYHHQMENYSS